MTLSEELTWRGFVNQTTLSDLSQLNDNPTTFYTGYDASDDSLTIGNLAVLMMNKCFIRHGYQAVILAGGATSLIGDPGGKDTERQLQSTDAITANVQAVQRQIEKLFGDKIKIVNNLDWFSKMNALEFLRDVGKHFSMTPLVQRDYIAKRMGGSGAGISYTEFSYTLLQGYDFLCLYQDHGVTLQLAGADQWGNGLSGVDLVRRVAGQEVHVLTCPLIVDKATGKKFGKSEGGAVWLDPAKTSPYKFYQFWLNADDEGVESYLKIFTELDKPAIDRVIKEFQADRGGRVAQKTLAYEATKLVHGQAQADNVKRASEVLFGAGQFLELKEDEVVVLRQELPVVSAEADLAKTLVKAGLAQSNTEATRFIGSGAIYINGKKVLPESGSDSHFQKGSNLLKKGKNSFAVVEVG
ncbi:MAG TPA: tyrosine--tRNA ligase [Candidatus Saccharimonadales bacterium]|nr:tyrosine--tRNA ligase [Candidatus Saccharimonadales bacterium]